MIVKELAVNILELNGYKTRTEQLDNELKAYYKIKNESNKYSPEYSKISEKTEVLFCLILLGKLIFENMLKYFFNRTYK